MSSAQRDRERHAALAVLFKAYKTYDIKSFKVDMKGPNHAPLRTAEMYGWCWFDGDRCAISDAGMRELEPYRRTEPKPVVQWICPVCLCVCGQLEDEAGLPERPSCPNCELEARELTARLRAEEEERERKSA